MASVHQDAQKETVPVTGMHCAGCAANVQTTLSNQPGVLKADVNFADESVLLEYNSAVTSLISLQEAVREIGYDLFIPASEGETVESLDAERKRAFARLRRNVIRAVTFSVPLVVIGMFFPGIPYAKWIMWALATPVVFVFGGQFFARAWQQLRHRRANMDTLVAMSTSIAYLFSVINTVYPQYLEDQGMDAHVYFEAAAVIITFVLLGRLLEDRARLRTSVAIRALMDLQPQIVHRVDHDGDTRDIFVEAVQRGDLLLVRPGEQIPVDGVLTEGSSYVDESMITGEPVPVGKVAEDNLFAGTINQHGSFHMRATEVGASTMLARIIRAVREAQGSKAPVQRLVDRIAGVFVPIVIAIALVSLIGWLVFADVNAVTYGLLSMVTVLVIACPCALGLATPTAMMVGIGRAAQTGILIKNAESLESAHRVDTILLDKTGTLTEGNPAISDIHWLVPETQIYTLQGILHALETRSEHPLAEAIVRHLGLKKALPVVINDFESFTGKGVKGNVRDRTYAVGTKEFVTSITGPIGDQADKKAKAWQDTAKTVVYFADQDSVLAIISITDPLKEGAGDTIRALHDLGIEVHLVTGDNRETASAVGQKLGIEHVHARMLPEEKEAYTRRLQKEGKIVAVVGDGINDTQAISRADVGIAMGKGSDIAIDVAGITIISSDLRKIPAAIHLSRKTTRTIRQNLFWAFIYNLIGIPIAAGVLYPFTGYLLNPMIAGGAMAMSSVSVVMNSLRLRWAGI